MHWRVCPRGECIMKSSIVLALAATWCLVASLAAGAADKKVVRIWQTESEPQSLTVLNQMAANFQKLRPDVEIQIEGLAWGELEKKLSVALAVGAPPDAAHGQPITCVSFAANGMLRPLDD